MSNNYRVRVKTDRFEIEVEGTEKDFVLHNIDEHLRRLGDPTSGVKRPHTREPAGNIKTAASDKAMSLQEFLNQVKPSSGPEYVIAIGYFLEKHQGLGGFNSTHIKHEFQKAKFQHSNPSDAIAKARAAGKLMDGPDPGNYVLTRSAESWVQERLSSQ